MIYLIISTIAWAFWSVCLSKSTNIPPLWATLFAYIPGLIISTTVVLSTTKDWSFIKSQGVLWALCAGICGTIGSLCFLNSRNYFSGAVVTSVSSLYPILSVFIFMLFGETITSKQIIGIIIAVVSVVFLVIPKGN